jgi:predicted GTPase
MSPPDIFIGRTDHGFYGWSIMYGQMNHAQRTAEPSIAECLKEALDHLPESEAVVNVTYRGVEVGRMIRAEIEYSPARAASEITSRFADEARYQNVHNQEMSDCLGANTLVEPRQLVVATQFCSNCLLMGNLERRRRPAE